MISLIHNAGVLNGSRMLKINSKKRARTAEKLSSGYRINRAADDASGLWWIKGLLEIETLEQGKIQLI